MHVSDLRDFLELPEDAPGPAVKMAERLRAVVRAATAEEPGETWESALICTRRPGRQACPGHLAVLRTDVPAEIHWRCTSCGEEGVVHGWVGSPFDLRRSRGEPPGADEATIAVPDEVAAALRELQLLDLDCERLVYRARVVDGEVLLSGTPDDLDDLLGYVAAESSHEPNRRRQARFDRAFDVLSDAIRDVGP
jgi:hypothetical protein